eukprot:3878552-Ditylum_brightwellii.AAC.1
MVVEYVFVLLGEHIAWVDFAINMSDSQVVITMPFMDKVFLGVEVDTSWRDRSSRTLQRWISSLLHLVVATTSVWHILRAVLSWRWYVQDICPPLGINMAPEIDQSLSIGTSIGVVGTDWSWGPS